MGKPTGFLEIGRLVPPKRPIAERLRDWGEVDEEDWKRNDEALEKGYPIVSSYLSRDLRRFMIVTEADRSATTILLPEER